MSEWVTVAPRLRLAAGPGRGVSHAAPGSDASWGWLGSSLPTRVGPLSFSPAEIHASFFQWILAVLTSGAVGSPSVDALCCFLIPRAGWISGQCGLAAAARREGFRSTGRSVVAFEGGANLHCSLARWWMPGPDPV